MKRSGNRSKNLRKFASNGKREIEFCNQRIIAGMRNFIYDQKYI